VEDVFGKKDEKTATKRLDKKKIMGLILD